MKKNTAITTLIIFGFISNLSSQITQVELFSGFDKTDFTLFSNYPINDSASISISTLAFFQKFSAKENQSFDEAGVQPTLFWNINKRIAIGPSLYYNSFSGYSERFSAKLTIKNSRLLFVVMPTIANSHKKKASYAEAFMQFQFNIPLNDTVLLWFNGQFLTVWDKIKTHSRSFQQIRAGISINGHQFGIGLDLDQFGPKPIETIAFGMYYRKTL